MTTTVVHPSIGEVTIAVSRRSRRISISVRPPGRVRLSMPVGVSVKEGMRFLESKREWIMEAQQKMAAKGTAEPISMPYSTRSHTLRLDPADTDRITVRVAAGEIKVRYPIEINYTEPTVQQAITKGIEEAWRVEAKQLLPSRTAELALRHGFRHGTVSVRNTRSRWGSCSARNDISLSIRLMKLPDYLIDYIILHELCHTIHKNHGADFHALLDKVCGGQHKQLRREIKKHSINIQ